MPIKAYKPEELTQLIQQTGEPAPSVEEQPEPEGFWHSLGSSLGFVSQPGEQPQEDKHPIMSAIKAANPAIGAIEGMYEGAKRTGGELMEAGREGISGNHAGMAYHAIKSIPIIGLGMDKAADQYADQDYNGEVGTLLGTTAQMAPLVYGAGESSSAKFLPSRANAARVFADIENQAANVPVSMKATKPALAEFKQTVDTGGKSAPVMTKLQKRITPPAPKQPGVLQSMQNDLSGQYQPTPPPPKPILFPEARDFYTNVSRATAKPGMLRRALESPQMPSFRMNAGNVREALNSDLVDAADQVGLKDDYTGAMKEYRRAAQLNKMAKVGGTIAAAEAARRTGLLGKAISGMAQ